MVAVRRCECVSRTIETAVATRPRAEKTRIAVSDVKMSIRDIAKALRVPIKLVAARYLNVINQSLVAERLG